MKITSIKYVHEIANKILGETQLGGSLSDREQAILHAGFRKLIDRLYATNDDAPEVLEFLRELTVIASGLTKHTAAALVRCQECGALIETDVHCDVCGTFNPTRR